MASLRLSLRRKRRRLMFLCARTLARTLGFARMRGVGSAMGLLQYTLNRRQRNRQLHDLAWVLDRPVGDPQVARVLREAYRVNTAAVMEIVALFDRRQPQVRDADFCVIDGLERVQQAREAGRGAILLPAHSGNGAAMVARLAAMGWPVSVVYKHSRMMSAGFFEAGFALYDIEGILANEGIKAYSKMLGALRKGRILFVMLDQGTKRREDGVVLRFLGKDMPI